MCISEEQHQEKEEKISDLDIAIVSGKKNLLQYCREKGGFRLLRILCIVSEGSSFKPMEG